MIGEEPLTLNRRTDAWCDATVHGAAMTSSGGASEEPLNRWTAAWYDVRGGGVEADDPFANESNRFTKIWEMRHEDPSTPATGESR